MRRSLLLMPRRKLTDALPLARQLRDPLGLGPAARSKRSRELEPRTRTADRMVQSICPYCAVGCGQRVYVKDEQVIQIEGDPDSPISRGRLCPKGSASLALRAQPAARDDRALPRAACDRLGGPRRSTGRWT